MINEILFESLLIILSALPKLFHILASIGNNNNNSNNNHNNSNMNVRWNNGGGCWALASPCPFPLAGVGRDLHLGPPRTRLWPPGSEALEMASSGPPHL